MVVDVSESRKIIVVPFVCPVCAGENEVNILALARAGGMDCAVCGKWLRSADVTRARDTPRPVRNADSPAIRQTTHARRSEPVGVGLRGTGVHESSPRRDRVVWPPTRETRASARPLSTDAAGNSR